MQVTNALRALSQTAHDLLDTETRPPVVLQLVVTRHLPAQQGRRLMSLPGSS